MRSILWIERAGARFFIITNRIVKIRLLNFVFNPLFAVPSVLRALKIHNSCYI